MKTHSNDPGRSWFCCCGLFEDADAASRFSSGLLVDFNKMCCNGLCVSKTEQKPLSKNSTRAL